jgi:hypothetical protein
MFGTPWSKKKGAREVLATREEASRSCDQETGNQKGETGAGFQAPILLGTFQCGGKWQLVCIFQNLNRVFDEKAIADSHSLS